MYSVQSSKSFLVGHRHIEIIGSSKERNKISDNISDRTYKQGQIWLVNCLNCFQQFYLLISYFEKFSIWICRLPFAVYVKLKLSNFPQNLNAEGNIQIRGSQMNCFPRDQSLTAVVGQHSRVTAVTS